MKGLFGRRKSQACKESQIPRIPGSTTNVRNSSRKGARKRYGVHGDPWIPAEAPRERRPPDAGSAPEESSVGCVVTAMASAAVLLRVGFKDLRRTAGRVGQDRLGVLSAEHRRVDRLVELR